MVSDIYAVLIERDAKWGIWYNDVSLWIAGNACLLRECGNVNVTEWIVLCEIIITIGENISLSYVRETDNP